MLHCVGRANSKTHHGLQSAQPQVAMTDAQDLLRDAKNLPALARDVARGNGTGDLLFRAAGFWSSDSAAPGAGSNEVVKDVEAVAADAKSLPGLAKDVAAAPQMLKDAVTIPEVRRWCIPYAFGPTYAQRLDYGTSDSAGCAGLLRALRRGSRELRQTLGEDPG